MKSDPRLKTKVLAVALLFALAAVGLRASENYYLLAVMGNAAPQYQSSAAQREGAGQATVSVDVSGIGIQAGDLLLAVCGTPTDSTTWSNTVGGFTELNDGSIAIYSKIASGSETTTTFVCSLDSGAKAVVVMRIKDAGTIADSAILEAAGVAANTTRIPTVTAATNKTLWVEVPFLFNDNDPQNWTAPDGTHTLKAEGEPGSNVRYAIGTKVVGSGATGNADWTHESNSLQRRSASIAVSPQ